jgi:heavy metal sensor kinase
VSFPVKARLTIWYVVVLGMILAAFGAFVFFRLKADLLSAMDRSLATRAVQISLGYSGTGRSNFQDVSDASAGHLLTGESAAQVIAPSGNVEDSSGDPGVAERPMLGPALLARVAGGSHLVSSVRLGSDGEAFRVFATPFPGPAGSSTLVVASSLEDVQRSIHRLLVLILAGIPVALGASAIGGWLLARKALSPVARMTTAAERIGGDRLDDRVAVPATSDELQRLALTLNAMFDRLQEGVDGQRRFVADASHDLRTPLTVMRSEIEVALEGGRIDKDAARSVLVSNREEVDRMTHLVDDLLTLASVQNGRLNLLTEPLQLRPLVCSVVDQLRALATAQDIQIVVDGVEPRVHGDRERVKQVATNLVDNAVKYSRHGSTVHVQVWQRAGEAGFTVTDAGPGIPEEALPRIFDRFFRVDGSRSQARIGSGLGLAICRDIVHAHRGRIWVESRVGTGSSFSVALPNE